MIVVIESHQGAVHMQITQWPLVAQMPAWGSLLDLDLVPGKLSWLKEANVERHGFKSQYDVVICSEPVFRTLPLTRFRRINLPEFQLRARQTIS